MPTNRKRFAWQVIWTLQLVAALAAVAVLNGRAAATSSPAAGGDAARRYGFRLEQVNRAAGINFVHQAPVFDARLEHIMPQIASTGASVSVADVDRDGWPDFYATTSSEGGLNRLYRNRGDGTFVDVAGARGVAAVDQAGPRAPRGAVACGYGHPGPARPLVCRDG